MLWSYKFYGPAEEDRRGSSGGPISGATKKGRYKKGGDDDDEDDEDAAGKKKKAPVPLDEHKPLDDGSDKKPDGSDGGKRFGGDAPPAAVLVG